ncbi:MAG: hypothetical protein IT318_27320 [Anaerolineales bacterium]|nr:hypothetical protein [Anaerolineales bacterium]
MLCRKNVQDALSVSTYRTQLFYSCLDTVNICQFVFGPAWHRYGPEELVRVVRAVTGWKDVTVAELMRLGERRLNMLRAFNAREGVGREADVLPGKLAKALLGGKSDGVGVPPEEVEQAKARYYALACWDPTRGNPTRAKLEALELGWVADLLGLDETGQPR